MPVYIEWIDMPGGKRYEVDGPFAFVALTYDVIRAQRVGDEDIELGTAFPGGGWLRYGDETAGLSSVGEEIIGWYSDITISTEPG